MPFSRSALEIQDNLISYLKSKKTNKSIKTRTNSDSTSEQQLSVAKVSQKLVDSDEVEQKKIDLEWEQAEQYFQDFSNEIYVGRDQGLKTSYFKIGEMIARRGKEIGIGSFGRVREMEGKNSTTRRMAIKRIKPNMDPWNEGVYSEADIIDKATHRLLELAIDNPDSQEEIRRINFWLNHRKYKALYIECHWFLKVKKEAYINYDLGIATTDLLVRRNEDGSIYKVYQELIYLGIPLADVILKKNERTIEAYIVKLLIAVNDLHAGAQSASNKPYIHGDLSLANIVVDNNDKIHLIDFGRSTEYVTHSLMNDEKDSVLLLISSILSSTELLAKVPEAIKMVLSDADESLTLECITAVFILYIENDRVLSMMEIVNLNKNYVMQNEIINTFKTKLAPHESSVSTESYELPVSFLSR